MKQKKIPMRMCVGCQEMFPKKELLRVVRTPDNQILVDRTGKKSGRGAYVCPRRSCLNKALKHTRLQKALGSSISEEVVRELEDRLVEI